MDEKNFIESALNAGAAMREPIAGVDNPCILVPPGYTVESLEGYQDQPNRKRAKVAFNDAVSFARYVTDHREPNTALFASLNESGALFTAILDYHSATKDGGRDSRDYSAGWKDHQVSYGTQETVEWKRWRAKNKQSFEQRDFAEFIEENLLDIVSPPGAMMLEVARTLQAKTSVDFKSGVRLDNGNESLQFEETTEAKAGQKGDLIVPSEFRLGIPLFVGGQRYALNARLRYRIVEKKLRFTYDIQNPHLAIKDACEQLVELIREKTGLDPFLGSAS